MHIFDLGSYLDSSADSTNSITCTQVKTTKDFPLPRWGH